MPACCDSCRAGPQDPQPRSDHNLDAEVEQAGGDERGEVGALGLASEGLDHPTVDRPHGHEPSARPPARDADYIGRAPDRADMLRGELNQAELHRHGTQAGAPHKAEVDTAPRAADRQLGQLPRSEQLDQQRHHLPRHVVIGHLLLGENRFHAHPLRADRATRGEREAARGARRGSCARGNSRCPYTPSRCAQPPPLAP